MTSIADFLNGYTASIMASTGSLGGIKQDATFDFGTSFLPEELSFGCCTGGAGLAIMADKSPEQQEAAFKFVSWATSPEQTEWWSQTTGYMPVRKSAIESETMQGFFADNPNFKTAVDQLPKTKAQDSARVFIPNGDQIIGKGLERITVQGRKRCNRSSMKWQPPSPKRPSLFSRHWTHQGIAPPSFKGRERGGSPGRRVSFSGALRRS